MAEHLSKPGKQVTICKCLTAGLLFVVSAAGAENLTDPTRPPASLGTGREQADVTPATGLTLQSVLISSLRRVAVINGQTVREGEKFGDARVARISENEVVLRSGRDVTVLKLYPHIEKEKRQSSSRSKIGAQGDRQ